MRRHGWLELLGLAAVLSTVAGGAAPKPWNPAAEAMPMAVAREAYDAHSCVLTVVRGAPRVLPESPASNPERVRSGGGDDLVVVVPAAVFIRATGRNLVVTTNTGVPPRRPDVFYYIANGRASVASARLRREVTAGCRVGATAS